MSDECVHFWGKEIHILSPHMCNLNHSELQRKFFSHRTKFFPRSCFIRGRKQKATGLYRTLTVRHLTYFLFRLVKAVPPTPVLRPLPHDTHLSHHHYPYHYQSHEGAYTAIKQYKLLGQKSNIRPLFVYIGTTQ